GNSRRWRHFRVVPADGPTAVEPTTTASVGSDTAKPQEPEGASPAKPPKIASKRTRSRHRDREDDRSDPGAAYASTATQSGWRDRREAREDRRPHQQSRRD